MKNLVKKESVSKFEKPQYFRGLRWKMMFLFVFLVFSFFVFLGIFGGLVEYAFLRMDFASSEEISENSVGNRSNLQIDNYFIKEQNNLKTDSPEIITWLDSDSKNSETIRLWLKAYREKLKAKRKTDFEITYNSLEHLEATQTPLIVLSAFDNEGKIIASSNDIDLMSTEDDNEKIFIKQLLKSNSKEKKQIDSDKLQMRFAYLIVDKQNEVIGGLFFKERIPFHWSQAFQNSLYWAYNQPTSDIIFLGILGLVFGSPFAWYLSKRLKTIAYVAHSWHEGDFSAKNDDNSSDEIGILSRNLNKMAEDLSGTFALKQIIATSEERNRIARDLHDSVKQQVFGLAMQISTAQTLLAKDTDRTKTHLEEAANLVEQIQRELVELIHESSSIGEQSGKIVKRIETLCEGWSRQTKIEFEFITGDVPQLSPIQTQTLYRITQEALANIARHAQATKIIIEIKYKENQTISLSISDNGVGFDFKEEIKGFGLQNIETRAKQLKEGKIEINSQIKKGTQIKIEFNLSIVQEKSA